MAGLDSEKIEAGFLTDSSAAAEQDLLRVVEQLEIQDLGELSLVAWRII
jgi:hypothetical protein